MSRLAVFVLVLVGCSSKSSAPSAKAGDAGVVAPKAPLDAPVAVAPKPSDAAAAVALALDAGADGAVAAAAVDAAVKPTAPADPSGVWFGARLPLGADFVALKPTRLDVAGPGGVDFDEDTWAGVVARKLDPASAEAAAVRGQKLTVYAEDGATCAAVVEDVLAVRTATVPFDLRRKAKEADGAAALDEALWKEAKDGFLAITTSGCDGALAIPADAPALAITKVKAASAEVEAAITDAFERGRGQDLDAKKELEELSGTPWKYTSTRVLGSELAVAYVKIFGERTIALYPVPPVGSNWPLAEIAADSPSTVIGLDADRDGELDALIGHPSGTALYLSGPEQLWQTSGVFLPPD